MLTAFVRAFRTPDLRKKLLFTLGIIALFRLGAALPTPGITEQNVAFCSNAATQGSTAGVLGLVNLLSGGALLQLSVFALGIMPYITASIILQLLAVVIPRLETLRQEGQAGQAKITQYTRYLTVGLAILQSTGIVALARSGNLFRRGVCTPAADPERLGLHHRHDGDHHDRGHRGHHVAGRADHRPRRRQRHVAADLHPGHRGHPGRDAGHLPGQDGVRASPSCSLVGVAIVAFVVFMEQAQRRIPVQYAKRMVGRKMYGGTSTYIPLKVNQAGVIPVIFASSLLYIPQLAGPAVRQPDQPAGLGSLGRTLPRAGRLGRLHARRSSC